MLKNKKVYVGKHSKEVQEKVFKLGYGWNDDNKTITCLNKPFLYFNDGGKITCGNNLVDFNNHSYNEIDVEEILAMEVAKPKKTIRDLYPLSGFSVDEDGNIREVSNASPHYSHELWNVLPSKEEVEAYKILPMLLHFRDKYNEGWKPDYSDEDETKYVISVSKNVIVKDHGYTYSRLFTFKNIEIRDKFFEDFEEELEIVKPLL